MSRAWYLNQPLPPTPVHPEETNDPDTTRCPCSTYFQPTGHARYVARHAHWTGQRHAILHAMLAANLPLASVLDFANCGRRAFLLRSRTDPDSYKWVAQTCKSRFCTPCALERASTIRTRLAPILDQEPTRFITLTLKSGGEPLQETVNRLFRCFRTLRRRPLWKERVRGGCAVMEIKRSTREDRWHVHLHVLAHGLYIPKELLRAEWLSCTGDSFVLDIRIVRNANEAASYIAKYIAKPISDHENTTSDELCELVETARRRRLLLTFGTWRKLPLLKDPDAKNWTRLADSDHYLLTSQTHRGFDLAALQALLLWNSKLGTAAFVCRELPAFPDANAAP